MSVVCETRRAAADLRPLLAFRMAGLRGRSRRAAAIAGAVIVGLTVGAAVIPAYVEGAHQSRNVTDLLLLSPTALLAFLFTSCLATVTAAGGRELLPRGPASVFPVSPTTDHFGALLMTPLNVAWLMQVWSLLGIAAYIAGPHGLWAVQLTTLCWVFVATATGQVVGWLVEWVRRGEHGVAVVRALAGLLMAGAAALAISHHVSNVFDRSPTIRIVDVELYANAGRWGHWLVGWLLLAACGVAAVAAGAGAAHLVACRKSRDEERAETRLRAAAPMPKSDLAALVRIDRGSVWRSVPLRRGFLVLAALPGLVAAAGQLDWYLLPVLPGLVAAGGALLFGVNAWCLDAAGALWRDSLPARPDHVFLARCLVLLELLVVAMVLTIVVAGVRAGGSPTPTQLSAVVSAVVVVSLQVVARSMHWSVRRPFSTDLRSARATPAPPAVMVGYSSYLALTSTLTGLVFATAAHSDNPAVPVMLGMPLAILAVRRLVITSHEWADPSIRARVVSIVAAH